MTITRKEGGDWDPKNIRVAEVTRRARVVGSEIASYLGNSATGYEHGWTRLTGGHSLRRGKVSQNAWNFGALRFILRSCHEVYTF